MKQEPIDRDTEDADIFNSDDEANINVCTYLTSQKVANWPHNQIGQFNVKTRSKIVVTFWKALPISTDTHNR